MNTEEKLNNMVDSMVRKTLSEMLEWDDIELTPESVYLFAAKKLDFAVTQEDVTSALQRILAHALKKMSYEELDEEGRDAITQFLHDHTIAIEPSLKDVKWAECDYETLEALHQILYYHGAPNLYYEFQ